MLPLKNYYFKSDYDGWQKFNGELYLMDMN